MDSKKINILKIPFELGILEPSKRGASKGPNLIELEYKKLNNANFINVNVLQDFKKTHENIFNQAIKQLKNGRLISIGGDHSISYSLIKAFKKYHPNSALVILDAHFDCQTPFDLPTHEDYLRLLITKQIVNPKDILLIGIRDYTKPELEFIQQNNISFLTPKLFKTELLKDFLSKYHTFYLSIDIDALDPSIAPGTGYFKGGGLNSIQVEEIINCLRNKKHHSFDIVEVSPLKDTGNTTSKLAANLLMKLL